MKKIHIIFLLSLFSKTFYGQLSWSVKAGNITSKPLNTKEFRNINSYYYDISAVNHGYFQTEFGYYFTKKMGVILNIGLMKTGYKSSRAKFKKDEPNGKDSIIINLSNDDVGKPNFIAEQFNNTYTKIGINVEYIISPKISAKVGIQTLFYRNSDFDLNPADYKTEIYTYGKPTSSLYYARYTPYRESSISFGGIGSKKDIGVNIGLNHQIWRGLLVELEYYRGFKPINDAGAARFINSLGNIVQTRPNLYNQYIAVGLGWSFKKNRG